MSMKLFAAFFVSFLVLTAGAAKSRADEMDDERATLKGLNGVCPVTSLLANDPLVKDGIITEAEMNTDLELRLRQSKIPVRTQKETGASSNIGLLILEINASKSNGTTYLVLLQEKLYQNVRVVRDGAAHKNDINAVISTWESVDATTAGPGQTDQIRKWIDDRIDVFCNDYLAAQAKP